MPEPQLAIGIDLGGTNIKAARIDMASGQPLATETRPTRDGEFAADATPCFAVAVKELIESLSSGDLIAAVGLSSPGLATPDLTRIHSMPNKMHGIEHFDWQAHLALPPGTGFAILNDAHAALMGEAWLGAAAGVDEVALLTLGTGVGGAILSGGKLLLGKTGRAGHLGHLSLDPWGPPSIVGSPGSLEDAIGNHTVQARSGGRFPDTASLIEAVKNDDAEATAIWRKSTDSLGAALVGIINALDPELIVLGGGIARAGDVLLAPLREFLDRHEWRFDAHHVRLELAILGDMAGTYGAARTAFQRASISQAP